LIKGIIFDLGSTVMRFKGEWRAVLEECYSTLAAHLKAGGLDLDEAAFVAAYDRYMDEFYVQRQHEWVEYTAAHLLRLCLADMGIAEVSEELMNAGLKTMFLREEEWWEAFDDAAPTLERLQAEGYRLGMISNASDDGNVQRLIDKAGLRPWLDPIIVSAAVGIRKPNPRIFEMVLERWELPPDQVVMVGDTLGTDILGAQLAGLRNVWATMSADTPANAAYRGQLIPDATIAALSELPGVLAQWNGLRVQP